MYHETPLHGKKAHQVESLPQPDEIGSLIEEVVELARQINSEVGSDNIRKLLNSHYQKITKDELHRNT
ncbi:hypothetical protein TNCV_2070991 [Trichonephila clavipes]|uniref:Uncharacterized protein n=1 Tax=Trichonephila clavipes TaxID=2585209 RepID=A0A8X6W3T1_TRICX|nr:hypothetical protein TNCV_2070991 [Trichonephila clavipes]